MNNGSRRSAPYPQGGDAGGRRSQFDQAPPRRYDESAGGRGDYRPRDDRRDERGESYFRGGRGGGGEFRGGRGGGDFRGGRGGGDFRGGRGGGDFRGGRGGSEFRGGRGGGDFRGGRGGGDFRGDRSSEFRSDRGGEFRSDRGDYGSSDFRGGRGGGDFRGGRGGGDFRGGRGGSDFRGARGGGDFHGGRGRGGGRGGPCVPQVPGDLRVLTNHHSVRIRSDAPTQYIHDVDFTINNPIRSRSGKPPTLLREEQAEIIEALFADKELSGIPAYDGDKKLIHKSPLNLTNEFNTKKGAVTVTVKTVSVYEPKDVLSSGLASGQLAALDVIVKAAALRECMAAGLRTFVLKRAEHEIPLRDERGRVLFEGMMEGVQLCANPSAKVADTETHLTLCIDAAARLGMPEQPLNMILQRVHLDLEDSRLMSRLTMTAADTNFRRITRGLLFSMSHMPKRRPIALCGLAQSTARSHTFDYEGREISVYEYFKEKYGMTLEYPDAPLVIQAPRQKNCFIPFEVLVSSKQIVNNRIGGAIQQAVQQKMTMRPDDRSRWVRKQCEISFGSSEVLEDWGFDVSPEAMEVNGFQLDAPTLGYRGRPVLPADGQWHAGSFLMGVRVTGWGIVCCDDRLPQGKVADFHRQLVSFGNEKMGMNLASTIEDSWWTDDFGFVAEKLGPKVKAGQIDAVLVVLPRPDVYLYQQAKEKLGEIIGTQVVVTQKTPVLNGKPMNVSHFVNILAGIQQKMGGGCQTIVKSPMTAFQDYIGNNGDTVVIGADLCHPIPKGAIRLPRSDLPSVVAVTCSINNDVNNYICSIRGQLSAGRDMIHNFHKCIEFLLRRRQALRKERTFPSRVIYLRDGVSDGELGTVIQEEHNDIKRAYRDLGQPEPRVMTVSVRKRHHTRLFVAEYADRGKNLAPGTIVFDNLSLPLNKPNFYLISHSGLIGTSKPTRYVVVRDEIAEVLPHINAMGWQDRCKHLGQFMYELCHLYGSCQRAVSLPVPVYHAHRLADHVRYHITTQARELLGIDLVTKEMSEGSDGGFQHRAPSRRTIEEFVDWMNQKFKKLEQQYQFYV